MIRAATLVDILLMCRDLRPDDIEHYMALSFDERWDFESAARYFDRLSGYKFCFVGAGKTLAVAGWSPITPGCFDGWMVSPLSTWETHGRPLTRACLRGMEYVFAQGARRLQLQTLESRSGACEWYERGLKMRREGTLYSYGRNGESVACFSRLRGE